MCVCVNTGMYVCTCVHPCMCTCMCTNVNMYAYVFTYMHTYMYVCICYIGSFDRPLPRPQNVRLGLCGSPPPTISLGVSLVQTHLTVRLPPGGLQHQWQLRRRGARQQPAHGPQHRHPGRHWSAQRTAPPVRHAISSSISISISFI